MAVPGHVLSGRHISRIAKRVQVRHFVKQSMASCLKITEVLFCLAPAAPLIPIILFGG